MTLTESVLEDEGMHVFEWWGGDFTYRGEKEKYEIYRPCPCGCISFHLKATPINRDENGNPKPNNPRPDEGNY